MSEKSLTIILAITISIIFASFLYLQMCTVSIYENYQIGISKIRILHPGIIILLFILLTIIIRGKSGKLISSLSWLFSKIAICICIVLAFLYIILEFFPVGSQWSYPHERTFTSTIMYSLIHPDFSNRSLMGLIYTLIFSFILMWISKLILEKRHNKPINSDRATLLPDLD